MSIWEGKSIHLNVDGEINNLSEKITPVAGDILLIEDSENVYSKKKIQIGGIAASIDTKVKVSSNDTTADYLDAKIIAADESNSTNIIELKEVGDGGDEDLKIAIDETKINHVNILNKGINTHTQIDTHIASMSNPHKTFPEYNFLAESFENPDNATWAVNSLANIWKPASDPTILVRAFDDTTEEGIGFTRLIPLGVTNIIFYFISYASTAPGTAKVITPKLYTRIYADNSAVGSWSAGLDLTSIDIPTNAYPQYDTQTIALSTLSLTAGEMVKFELTRKTIGVTSNLVGDWWLHYLRISFS